MVLPQFHPIPENDAWWGKGFTEWTNVVKAKPLFPGHRQPRLPADLGFYDMRLPETRMAQAELALEAGLGGFCYYHYSFGGKQLLQRPMEDVLASKQPGLPFCFCWANESWSRAWDGQNAELLIEQTYSAADDESHIEALLPYFADLRHVRVAGRPLFVFYRPDRLPDIRRTVDRWRTRALQVGIGELCLAQFDADGTGRSGNPADSGLDLSIEFTPDWRRLAGRLYSTPKAQWAIKLGVLPKSYRVHRVFDYASVAERTMVKPKPDYPFVRCVSPGFDNSPRRPLKDATILHDSTPARYEQWLRQALAWTARHDATNDGLIFINAWNEWAEGNHLEPDAVDGKQYIHATRRAIDDARKGRFDK